MAQVIPIHRHNSRDKLPIPPTATTTTSPPRPKLPRQRSQSEVVRSHSPLRHHEHRPNADPAFAKQLDELVERRKSISTEISSMKQQEKYRRLSLSNDRLNKESDYAQVNSDFWRAKINGFIEKRGHKRKRGDHSNRVSASPTPSHGSASSRDGEGPSEFPSHICILLEEIRGRTNDLKLLEDWAHSDPPMSLDDLLTKLLDRQSIFRKDVNVLCSYGFNESDFTVVSSEYETMIRNVAQIFAPSDTALRHESKHDSPRTHPSMPTVAEEEEPVNLSVADLFKKMDMTTQENTDLKARIVSLEKRKQKSNAAEISRIDELEREVESLNSRVVDLQDENALLESENEELRAKNEDLEIRIEGIREQIDVSMDMIKEAEICEEENKRLRDVVVSAEEQIGELQGELEAERESKNEIRKKLSKKDGEIDAVKERMGELESRYRIMGQKCNNAEHAVHMSQEEVAREKAHHRQDVQKLEDMLEKQRNAAHDIAVRLSDRTTQLETAQRAKIELELGSSPILYEESEMIHWVKSLIEWDVTGLRDDVFRTGEFYLKLCQAVDDEIVLEMGRDESENLERVIQLVNGSGVRTRGLKVQDLLDGHGLAILYFLCRIRVWAGMK